jgi:hypothetical protein
MNKDLEKWALPILKKYQKILLLDDHILRFRFSKDVSDDDQMHAIIRHPYKDIVIEYGSVASKMWKDKKKDELKETLIHELTHTLTNPLFQLAKSRYTSFNEITDANEYLVDHITNVIVKNNL